MTTVQMDDREFLKEAINAAFADSPEICLNQSQHYIIDALTKYMHKVNQIKGIVIAVEYDDPEDGENSIFEMDYSGGLNLSIGLVQRAQISLNKRVLEAYE